MTLHLVIISHVSCCKYDFRKESLGLLLMSPIEPFDSDIQYQQTILALGMPYIEIIHW